MPPLSVAAPFHGHASLLVRPGERVEAGAVLARVEAVKLEAAVTAPVAGVVERVAASGDVDGGDVLVVLS
jgi:pyruvate carboxylase